MLPASTSDALIEENKMEIRRVIFTLSLQNDVPISCLMNVKHKLRISHAYEQKTSRMVEAFPKSRIMGDFPTHFVRSHPC